MNRSLRVCALSVGFAVSTVSMTSLTAGATGTSHVANVARVAPATIAVPAGGYRLAGADGNVYALGSSFTGSLLGKPLARPIVGIASTPRFGYWLVASDGGIFTFGDAHFFGSTGAMRLNQPIVGMAPTRSAQGYWLVASDGGIFTFGDARFFGSTGAMRLNKPIVGMAATPTGQGYWLVASDGGIFTFGDAAFYGSMGGRAIGAPVVGMSATSSGRGYDFAGADGAVYSFGDAHSYGSAWGRTSAPIVGITAATNVNPYTPGATGYDISWPQCGGAYPALPHAVTIVGVNDGHMFSTNPCLTSEVTWAGPTLTVYVNANPLPYDNTSGLNGPAGQCAVANLHCRAYNWGRMSADYDAVAGATGGVHTSMWWLDVELNGGWRTDDLTLNAWTIQGLIDGLRGHGAVVGIYSTHYQWGVITGGAAQNGTPIWVPTGSNDPSLAQQYCSPSHGFGGGITWLTQWTVVYDQDYACPQ